MLWMDMERILLSNTTLSGKYIRHFGGRGDGDQYLLNAHGIMY